MEKAVDIVCMSRPRPDTLNNREPAPPPEPRNGEQPEDGTTEDERVVFSSWDGPLVPPLTRR
jgi:hypothetical protein